MSTGGLFRPHGCAARQTRKNQILPSSDVVRFGNCYCARPRALDAANAEAAGSHRPGALLFGRRQMAIKNTGNARSNRYKGKSANRPRRKIKNGRKKWAAIKKSIAALDPCTEALRDDKEEARVGNLDHTGSTTGPPCEMPLMSAHADIFPASSGDRENTAKSDRSNEAL